MRLLRPTWFEIDLDAAVDNLRAVRRLVGPGRKIVAVVKADAYGFGSLEMGRAFAAHGADALGVADLADGVRLRDAGLTRSEEHTSELQSHSNISYAVFCL